MKPSQNFAVSDTSTVTHDQIIILTLLLRDNMQLSLELCTSKIWQQQLSYDSYQCSQLLQGAGIVYSYTWTEGNASYTHTLTIAFVI